MKLIPKWWDRDLEVLDPSYETFYFEEYDYFVVKKKLRWFDKRGEHFSSPWLATFKVLNDAAMTNLRERKFIGRQYDGKTKAYLKYIKELNLEAKEKARLISLEMVAEGAMKIHELETKTMFT